LNYLDDMLCGKLACRLQNSLEVFDSPGTQFSILKVENVLIVVLAIACIQYTAPWLIRGSELQFPIRQFGFHSSTLCKSSSR
jgi:hypothetical protein